MFLAGLAKRDLARFDGIENGITRYLEAAFGTGCGCKGSVTLHNLLWSDTRIGLNVVDVLGVVRQKFALVL